MMKGGRSVLVEGWDKGLCAFFLFLQTSELFNGFFPAFPLLSWKSFISRPRPLPKQTNPFPFCSSVFLSLKAKPLQDAQIL